MLRTIEAVVEKDGSLRLLEHVELRAGERALVTILGEEAEPAETALLSQPALAADWDREEEDEAWRHLQP
jgi:predicted DNA-binding antitoxin AbrB/MazE fold protein